MQRSCDHFNGNGNLNFTSSLLMIVQFDLGVGVVFGQLVGQGFGIIILCVSDFKSRTYKPLCCGHRAICWNRIPLIPSFLMFVLQNGVRYF